MANLSGKWRNGAGGIIGSSNGNNYIYNSYNIGNIELIDGTSYASTGGIVGYDKNNDIVIENCYNMGVLKSSKNIGGIVGNGNITLKNCFYLNNLNEGQGNIMENNAIPINEQQLKGIENIDEKSLVDMLNEYVETKNKIDDIQLKKWKQLEEYPVFNKNEIY